MLAAFSAAYSTAEATQEDFDEVAARTGGNLTPFSVRLVGPQPAVFPGARWGEGCCGADALADDPQLHACWLGGLPPEVATHLEDSATLGEAGLVLVAEMPGADVSGLLTRSYRVRVHMVSVPGQPSDG